MIKLNVGKDLYLKGRIGWRGLSKDEYLPHSEYRIINGTALMDSHIDWENCGYISQDRYFESEEIMLQEGDILISKDGTIGKIGYVKNLPGPCTVASGIFVLRNVAADKLNSDYLYHVLKSGIFKDFVRRNKANGSTINHLYQRDLEQFELDLPSLVIQNQVSNVLNSLEQKIANNNAINAELEAMAKTVYDYWFLQFEFPDENGNPYKSSGGKMVYNEELKHEIPEAWNVAKVIDCVDMVNGFPFSSDDYVPDGPYKLYTIKNVQDGHILSDVDNCLDSLPNKLPGACILEPSDIIMSLTGNVGRVGLVYESNVLLNQRVVKLVPHNHHIAYTYLLFRDDYMKTRMDNLAIGAAQKNLSPVNVGNLLVQAPSEVLLQSFDKICNPIVEKIVKNSQENQELASLRDFLLPLLMNGQVGFKD